MSEQRIAQAHLTITDITDGVNANIWTTSTAPTTPNYTFTISNLTGSTDEPRVGDIILQGVYRYTISSISSTTVLAGSRQSLQGASGAAGGKWYSGTGITGTSTTATIFSGSGVSSAVVGDMYLNTSTSNVYRCTVAGNASTAKWVYTSNIKGSAGSQGRSVTKVETEYYRKNSGGSSPGQDTTGSTSIPEYIDGCTYYTRTVTYFDSGNPEKGAWIENTALTNENKNAYDAWIAAGAAELKVKKVVSNSSGVIVASGIGGGDITESDATTYGYNTIMASNYLGLRYNAINLAKLTTTETVPTLDFYIPTVNNGVPVQGVKGLSINSNGLIFYRPSNTSQGTMAMKLDGTSLNFYDSTGQTVQASFGGTQATVSGTINAYDGKIGGFIIDETSIHNKMESFDDEILIPHEEGDVLIISDTEGDYLVDDYELGTNDYLEGDIEVDDFSGVYMGTDGIALGKGVFKINKYGSLYATKATIEGDITATSGKFGVETGYYEVDEHGLIGYIIGDNEMVTSGTELGYDYLKTDKIIASDGMRVMDENDTFVSFERTSSIFGIDGQSRFFISATGLNFINGREQSLFSVAQDQVERIEKTVAVVSFSTNTDVDELTRFISDIDVTEEITPYAELKINDNNDTRYRPYTLVNCVVTTESGVNVTINSDAVDDIISKMSYTYPYEYYEVTTDSTIVEGKNYYDSSENLIDPNDYVDSETGEQKSPSEEGWLEYKVESRTGYYSCTINVIYTANIISSSIVKIRGNIEVTSQGNPIRIINNEWNTNEGGNTDTMLRATNTVTGVEVGFGVGSGGQNHGIWSEKIKNWIIYCDENNNIQIPASNTYISGFLHGTTGEFSTNVRVVNNSGNGAAVHATCNNKSVALHTSAAGNRGIYDAYRGGWLLYSPPGGSVYIPPTAYLQGHAYVSGNLEVGMAAGADHFMRVRSGSGSIYMHAYNSTTGNRGIYSTNAAGSGFTIMTVNQSGVTHFPNSVTFGSNPSITRTSGDAAMIHQALAGRIYLYSNGSSTGNRGIYSFNAAGTAQGIMYVNQSGQTHLQQDLFSDYGTLNLGVSKATALHVSCVWSDGNWHDIITRNSNENTLYFGGSNSLGFTTNTYIRGSNVKLQGSSGATISSDRNIKKDILEYDSKYDDFYDALNPITYKYIHGTSGRTHCGFISQDVRDALISSGLKTSDFGGYILDKITSREVDSDGTSFEKSDTNYLLDHDINEIHQLIYSEFISLNTWQIQKLKKRVSELEKKLEELKKTLQ